MSVIHFRKLLIGATLIASAATPAFSADLYDSAYEAPAPSFSGWYLRGHVGMSNQHVKELQYEYFDVPGFSHNWLDEGGFDSAPIGGVGIGYAFNNWLRADITGEYRGKSSFHALDSFTNDATGDVIGTNQYSATKSEWLVLANAYIDLGEFNGISPYIGAGIGASRNTIANLDDINEFAGGGGYASKDSKWDLAWALHAGVGYAVSDRMTMDLGYSFVHLGDGKTGPARNYDPNLTRPNDGFTFKDIYSHDFKLGLRYKFN